MPSTIIATVILAAGALLCANAASAEDQAPARAPASTAAPHKLDLSGFKLVWQDDFNGDRLDPSKWHEPSEQRQGACRWAPALVTVKDGVLHLGIQRTGDPVLRYDCGAVQSTMFQHGYGYFEARCRMPKHIGADYWAAFWMMAGSVSDKVPDTRKGTEIDIMESFTFAQDARYGIAFHWNGYGKKHNSTGLAGGEHPEVLDGKFHTFGLYWDKNWYVAFLDGVEVGRTNMKDLGKEGEGLTRSQGTCQKPPYIILSCEAAPWAGKSPTWEAKMPKRDEFLVDYVRVYQGTLPAPIPAPESARR